MAWVVARSGVMYKFSKFKHLCCSKIEHSFTKMRVLKNVDGHKLWMAIRCDVCSL